MIEVITVFLLLLVGYLLIFFFSGGQGPVLFTDEPSITLSK